MEKPKRQKFRQETVIHSYIHRPLSIEIIRLIWNTKITANQITCFRAILNLISLIFFSQGTSLGFIVGFVLFQIHEVLDHVDGMYSRLKKQTSKMGAYLEYLVDDLFSSSYGLFGFSIAYGAYTFTGELTYIWLFLSITIGHSLTMVYLVNFETQKICEKGTLQNIDHDSEKYLAIFGGGFKKGIINLLKTSILWKNEFLLWGALSFTYIKEVFGLDTLILAFTIHAIILNLSWIKRAYVGFKKAKAADATN